MMGRRFVLVFLTLSAVSCAFADVPPEFVEGDVNSTISVIPVVSQKLKLRCTIKSEDVDLKLLEMEPQPGEGDNWVINRDEATPPRWIEADFTSGVTKDNKGMMFRCLGINQDNDTGTLDYSIQEVYDGITFEEADINSTLSKEYTNGDTNSEIRCTVKSADPPVIKLGIEPLPGPGDIDYRLIGEEDKYIGVQFIRINSATTPNLFVCTASNNVTKTTLNYAISVYDGIKFGEGDVNSTVNHTLITETKDSIRCTVSSSDPPITELEIEPKPSLGEEDYRLVKEGSSIGIDFININDKTPTFFKCTARNNLTTATLSYNLAVTDPVAPVFTYGGNDTIWTEIAKGANHTLYCTLANELQIKPPITSVTAMPSTDHNWKIVEPNNVSAEIQITGADPIYNRKDYICIASNAVRTTQLYYQTYAGGAPNSVDVKLNAVINRKKVELTLHVTDRSDAPAQHILVYIEGITDSNITLNVSIPHTDDDEITYTFDKFFTPSLTSVRDNPVAKVYAKNTLGDAYVKEITISVPAIKKNSISKGGIAAAVLVPIILVIGGVVIGVVVFYYWKKRAPKPIRFSKINGDNAGIDDASKSTYGAL